MMIWATAIVVLTLNLAGCSSESMSPIEVTLEPFLQPSTLDFVMGPNMVGTDADNQPVSFTTREIDGFQFEWGVRQKLRLNRHHVKPLADAPSIEYSLSRTLSKEAIPGWSFRSFPQDSAALRLDGDTLRISGYERPILIASDQDRAKLAAKSGMYLDLRVRPAAEELVGDSVRVLHPDSTGRLVPG